MFYFVKRYLNPGAKPLKARGTSARGRASTRMGSII